MAAPILPVSSIPAVEALRTTGKLQAGGFQDVFASAVKNVEAFGQNASASVDRFLGGEGEELHTTIMATQRAELAFEMFLQMRNKVVSAYQEVMRMQM
jgi:flagellar hook-basal body complex protein FliE